MSMINAEIPDSEDRKGMDPAAVSEGLCECHFGGFTRTEQNFFQTLNSPHTVATVRS